jgi:hypothetical protein
MNKFERYFPKDEWEGKFEESIMEDLRQRRGLEEDDDSEDNEIMKMDLEEALDEVASWNGLIGYGNTIKRWVQEIYNIDLDSIGDWRNESI